MSQLLHCDGSTTRTVYLRNVALLVAGKAAIDLQVMPLRPDLFSTWSWPASWANPFLMIDPWMNGEVPFLICCTTFAFFTALVWNSVHRARHAGIPHWVGLVAAIPFVNTVAVTLLMVWPAAKRRSVFDLP